MSLSLLLKTIKDGETSKAEAQEAVESRLWSLEDDHGVNLKKALQSGRLKLSKGREVRPKGRTFRPSDLTYPYCERAKVAQLAGLIDLYDKAPTPRLQVTFDLGHAIHDIFQTYFWDIGQLKGTYKCTKCDKLYHDLISPEACPSGIKSHTRSFLKYKEVVYKHPDYLISGRCDGIIVTPEGERLVDFKSIANKADSTSDRQFTFEDLKESGPPDSHLVQLMLYMWISGIHNGHMFYIAKNTSQTLSFAVKYDFSILEPHLNRITELIIMANKLRQGEKVDLPATCSKADCPCESILSNQ